MGTLAVLTLLLALTAADELRTPTEEDIVDMLGDTDIREVNALEQMSEKEKLAFFSENAMPLLSESATLPDFTLETLVDVKLVGLDGTEGISLDPKRLQALLDRMPSNFQIFSVLPEVKRLAVYNKLVYRVTHAPSDLSLTLANVLEPFASRTWIPVPVVDDIIADFSEKHGMTFTIFILNPRFNCSASEPAPCPPRHWFFEAENIDAAPPLSGCGVGMWMGRAHRYLWIDITAGPLEYGPSTVGEGIVAGENSVPFLPSTAAHPQRILPQLAAFADRVGDYVLNPPLWNFPVKFHSKLEIAFFVIYERHMHFSPLEEQQLINHWEPVRDELESLAFPGQELKVSFRTIHHPDCPMCVLALANALKSHTSRARSEKRGDVKVLIHQSIDSKELAHWLRHHYSDEEDLWEWNVPAAAVNTPTHRLVPVYLYDFSRSSMLLLDRVHQAVAMDDMVVAVQSHHGKVPVDFTCSGNRVMMDTSDARRAVLAAVLKTGWGVHPTHETYLPVAGELVRDYAFSACTTPFAPFSGSLALHRGIRDVAMRNVVISAISERYQELASAARHLKESGLETSQLLSAEDASQLNRRWKLFQFKLERAAMFLSMQDYDHAMYFVWSSQRDSDAIHAYFHAAYNNFDVVLHCEHGGAHPSEWNVSFWIAEVTVVVCSAVFSFLLGALLLAVLRRTTGRPRKQWKIQ